MKRHILSFLFLFGVIISIISCKTDVDLYADYEEIVVVYGILEPDVDTTYIKITKAFLNGNAYEMAKIPDSSNFSYKLDARLIGKKNGNIIHQYTLDTITIHNKQAGDSIFYFPNSLMYYTTEPLDSEAIYTLEIYKKDGELITATTEMTSSVSIKKPIHRILTIQNRDNNNLITVLSAKNAIRHECRLVFYYKELIPGNPDTLNKSYTWVLPAQTAASVDGGEELVFTYVQRNFYVLLENHIKPENDVHGTKRFVNKIEIVATAGGYELTTMINLSQSTGMANSTQYTNIENGYGIFSSRSSKMRSYEFNADVLFSTAYRHLGFIQE
ncbi:MAG: hypothetical protein LBM67_08160 [Lentimicrobiaceae bacterium]|jgi:hypothetical protein|nr:hypothetical protein [Lentimicrobiaceae bacterium]